MRYFSHYDRSLFSGWFLHGSRANTKKKIADSTHKLRQKFENLESFDFISYPPFKKYKLIKKLRHCKPFVFHFVYTIDCCYYYLLPHLVWLHLNNKFIYILILGAAISYRTPAQHDFSLIIFILNVFIIITVHCAGNLVNTYFDYVKGIDTRKSDDRTLVDHLLTKEEVSLTFN